MNHKDYKADLFRLMQKHPELPVIPMVSGDVVGDDDLRRWAGSIGRSGIDSVYVGEDNIHFSSEDDWYEVLQDIKGCETGYTADGRDIDDLSDEECEAIYESLPWFAAIVVNIDEYGAG